MKLKIIGVLIASIALLAVILFLVVSFSSKAVADEGEDIPYSMSALSDESDTDNEPALSGTFSGQFGPPSAVGIFVPSDGSSTIAFKGMLEHESGAYASGRYGTHLGDGDTDNKGRFEGEWFHALIGYQIKPRPGISIWGEAGIGRAKGSAFSYAGMKSIGTKALMSKEVAIGGGFAIPLNDSRTIALIPFGEVRYHLPDEIDGESTNIFTHQTGVGSQFGITDSVVLALSGTVIGHGESDIVKEGDLTDIGAVTTSVLWKVGGDERFFVKPELSYLTILGDEKESMLGGEEDSYVTGKINIGINF